MLRGDDEDQVSAIDTSPMGKETTRSADRTKKRKHLSVDGKALLLAERCKLGARPPKGSVKALANRFGVSTRVVRRLLQSQTLAIQKGAPFSLSRKSGSGRPPVITPEMGESLVNWARTEMWEFTYAMAAEFLGVGRNTVKRHMEREEWRKVKKSVRPFITMEQMAARVEWCQKWKHQRFDGWVDIDEKWFYAITMHTKLKVPKGEKVDKAGVVNRSHIPKVMFLVGVAKPDTQHDFNGFLGCWRVGEYRKAKRKSKNYNAGELRWDDKNLDSDMFVHLMTYKVIPAVRKKMWWYKQVRIQMDNAPGHASKATWEKLNDSLKCSNKDATTKIILEFQPPKSPDTNLLDLAIFPSMSRRVAQLQKGCDIGDKETLSKNVQKVVDSYPPDTLMKAWETKRNVMQQIIIAGGANDYALPRSTKRQINLIVS